MLAAASLATLVQRVALVGATSTRAAADSRAAVCMQAMSKPTSLSSVRHWDSDSGAVTIAMHVENA